MQDSIKTLGKFSDTRGVLVPLEMSDIPFTPKRLFYVYDVPVGTWRGGHAHYKTEQILICVKGKIGVKLESKKYNTEIILNEGDFCFVDKMVWDSQNFIDEGSILLVLCSTNFDKTDYIFDKNLVV